MEDDWDLFAVVRRGCAAVTATSSTVPRGGGGGGCSFLPRPCLEDTFEPTGVNLYNTLFPYSQNPPSQTVPSQTGEKSHIQTGPKLKQQPFSVTSGTRTKPGSRSKRRKNHLKKVCHVAAENLSSDMWSWRKYGQKPIKGSPYPRGYYRCSTSKGCLARKQVERNRSDPGMFIITYTAEHNHPMPTHRNLLAGVTRQKVTAEEPAVTAPEDVAGDEVDDVDNFSATQASIEDDFFAGLEDLVAATAGGCGESHFPAAVLFPWSAATAAGGGG